MVSKVGPKKAKGPPINNKSVVYIIKAAFPANPERTTDVQDTLDKAVDELRSEGYAMVVDMEMVDKPFDDALDTEFERDREFLVKGKAELERVRLQRDQARQALLDAADIINPAVIDASEGN